MFSVCSAEIAQLTSSDSGIAETPETDDSVSIHELVVSLTQAGSPAGNIQIFSFLTFSLSVSEPQHGPEVPAETLRTGL